MNGSDTELAYRATLDGSNFATNMQRMESSVNQFGIRTSAASTSLGGLGQVIGTLASPMTAFAAGAMAAGAALNASVSAARAWETAMAGVSKTTGLSGKDLQGLSKELLDMSTKMPIAADGLAKIAQVAGSLGVAKENIAGFAEAAAMMGIGFEMSAEQAATSAAKILTAYGKPIDTQNMMALGNVVNSLGDSFAATEPQILDFINRAAYLSTTFGLSIPQVAAWGTALISAGLDADTAATGIKSLMNMSLDPKKFEQFAKVAGMSTAELKARLNEDVIGTYSEISKKIGESTDSVQKFQTVSKLAGTEGMTAFLKMGTVVDSTTAALVKASAEWQNGSSLMKTYEAQAGTLDAQMQIFWNTLNKAGVQLGSVLLPYISSGVKNLTEFTKAAIAAGEALYAIPGQIAEMGQGASDWLYEASGGLLGFNEMAAETGTTSARILADNFQDNIPPEAFAALDENLMIAGEEAGANAGTAAAVKFENQFQEQVGRSGITSEALLGMINSQSAPDSSIKEAVFKVHDTAVRYWYDAEETMPIFHLSLDGVEVATQTKNSGLATPTPEEMLAMVGITPPKEDSVEWYRMKMDEVKAQIEEVNAAARAELLANMKTIKFDRNAVMENIAPIASMGMNAGRTSDWLKTVLESYVNRAAEGGQDTAQTFAETFAEGMASPDITNLGAMEAARDEVIKSLPWQADDINAQFDAYKNAIRNQISDAGTFIASEMVRMGGTAKDAFKDGLLNDSEKDTLLGMEPELRYLQQTFPEEFAKAGGDSKLALIDALKAGDLDTAMATLATSAGNTFVDVLNAVLSGKTIDWSSMNISDPNRYMEYAKKELAGQANAFAEKGMGVPKESTTYKSLEELYNNYFQPNYDKLDETNRRSADLLYEALTKGGTYWNAVYEHMGLYNDEIGKAANNLPIQSQQAGAIFGQSMVPASKPIYDAGNYVKVGLNEQGQHVAKLGSIARVDITSGSNTAKNDFVAGGRSLYSSAQQAGNLMASAAANAMNSISAAAAAAGRSALSNIGNPTKTTSSSNPWKYDTGSDLWTWGGRPKSYAKGGYVGSAQLSVIGDRPGGEWVLGADDVAELSENVDFLGCAVSDFARAQESMVGLFKDAYIGPTGGNSGSSRYSGGYSGTGSSGAGGSDLLQYTAEGSLGEAIYENSCAISDFAKAQESMLGLFKESYIGPTSGYKGTGRYSGGSQSNYGSNPWAGTSIMGGGSSSGQFAPLYGGASSGLNNVSRQSDFASQSMNLLKFTAEGLSDTMYDCECAISDFARAQESATGLFYESYIGPTAGWAGKGKGAVGSSGYGGTGKTYYNKVGTPWQSEQMSIANPTWSLPPVFNNPTNNPWWGTSVKFANEGFAPHAMHAIIGDRPGGEYVMGVDRLNRLERMVSRGTGNVNIHMPRITINGSGLSAEALEEVENRVMHRALSEVTEQINTAINGGF